VEQTVAGSTDWLARCRWSSRLARIGAAALIALSLCACGAPNAADPRLVILYSTCTVNKDYLGPYNDEVPFTPSLDRFAEEAAVFRSHRTESGVSGTSFASIYAGVQADRHGVFKHPRALSEDLYLIFEAFADAGYETFYWAAHGMTEPELAYGQGVEAANVERQLLSGRDERFLAILDRLEADPSYRALVVTSFSVTHAPYDLRHVPLFLKRHPEEAGGLTREEIQKYFRIFQRNASELQTSYAEAARRLGLGDDGIARLADVVDLVYKSKIHVLDTLFGSVQEAVDEHGLADTSLIAFTADHGQQLYNEDRLFQWSHGPDLAPEVIDVPLLIKGPASLVPARTIEDVTRSIDVYPTLAGLSGIALPAEAGIEGADLSPGLRGEEPFPPLRAYSHGTLRRYKYFDPDVIDNIWASSRVGPTLYTWRHQGGTWDLAVESVAPEGAGAVLDREDPLHRAAADDLWAYRERMIAAYREQNPDEPGSKQEELEILTEDEARALKALGYIE
jgi:hypothetical protein